MAKNHLVSQDLNFLFSFYQEESMQEKLQDLIVYKALNAFDTKEKFFFRLLWHLAVVPTTRIETVAITYHFAKRTFQLEYNKEFVNELWNDKKKLTMVLLHEAIHYALLHPLRQYKLIDLIGNQNRKIAILAIECACNEVLLDFFNKFEELKLELIHPVLFGLQPQQSAEEYAVELLKQRKKQKKQEQHAADSEETNNISDRDTAGNKAPHSPELQKFFDEEMSDQRWKHGQNGQNTEAEDNDIINTIIEQEALKINEILISTAKQYGNLPGNLEDFIQRQSEASVIPYYRFMRGIITTILKTKKRTLTRMSRRRSHLEIAFPGYKKKSKIHVVWCLDTSASMNQPELTKGLAELESLTKSAVAKITVIEADAEVEKVYEIDSTRQIQDKVYGRGGTNFDPALTYAKNLKPVPDVLFYYTDGYAPAPHVKTKFPRYWIITKHGKPIPEEVCISVETGSFISCS